MHICVSNTVASKQQTIAGSLLPKARLSIYAILQCNVTHIYNLKCFNSHIVNIKGGEINFSNIFD